MLEGYCVDCDQCRKINDFSHLVIELPLELFQKGLSSAEILRRWLRNSNDMAEAELGPKSLATPNGSPSSACEGLSIVLGPWSKGPFRVRRTSARQARKQSLGPQQKKILEKLTYLEQLAIVRAVARRNSIPRRLFQEQEDNSHAMADLELAYKEAIENEVELDHGTPESEAEQILQEIGQAAFDCVCFRTTGGQKGQPYGTDNISHLMSKLEKAKDREIARLDAHNLSRLPTSKDATIAFDVNKSKSQRQEKQTRAVKRRSAFAKFKSAVSKRTSISLQSSAKHLSSSVREVSMFGSNLIDLGPVELEALGTKRHKSCHEGPHLSDGDGLQDDLSAWERSLLSGNLTIQEMMALDNYFDTENPVEIHLSAGDMSACVKDAGISGQVQRFPSRHVSNASNLGAMSYRQHLTGSNYYDISDKMSVEDAISIKNSYSADIPSPTSMYSRSEKGSYLAQPTPRDRKLSLLNESPFGTNNSVTANSFANFSGRPSLETCRYSGVPPFVINENIPYLQSPSRGNTDEMVFTPDLESMSGRDNFIYMLKTSFDIKLAQKEGHIALQEQRLIEQEEKIALQNRRIAELRTALAGLRREQLQRKPHVIEDSAIARSHSSTSGRGNLVKSNTPTMPRAHAFATPPIRTLSASPPHKMSSFKRDATAKYSPSKMSKNLILQQTIFEGMGEYERLRNISTSNMTQGRQGLLSPGIFDADESIELDCGSIL